MGTVGALLCAVGLLRQHMAAFWLALCIESRVWRFARRQFGSRMPLLVCAAAFHKGHQAACRLALVTLSVVGAAHGSAWSSAGVKGPMGLEQPADL